MWGDAIDARLGSLYLLVQVETLTRVTDTRKREPDYRVISEYPRDGDRKHPCLVIELETLAARNVAAMRRDYREHFNNPDTIAVLGIKIFLHGWGAAAVLWERDAHGAIKVTQAVIFGVRSVWPLGIDPAEKARFEVDMADGLPAVDAAHWLVAMPHVPLVPDGVMPGPFAPRAHLRVPAHDVLRTAVNHAGVPRVPLPTALAAAAHAMWIS